MVLHQCVLTSTSNSKLKSSNAPPQKIKKKRSQRILGLQTTVILALSISLFLTAHATYAK